MADDQRVRPSVQARERLLAAIAAPGPAHAVDAGVLGEYAQVLTERGHTAAAAQYPAVLAHLGTGCADCAADLQSLLEMAADFPESESGDPADDPIHAPGQQPPESSPDPGTGAVLLRGPRRPEPRPAARPDHDSGFHVQDLPDPRRAEADAARREEAVIQAEAARRARARWWRERLLVAAAIAVLLMGLSLIGMAYLAREARQTAPRVVLTPLPVATPGQAAPFAPDTGATSPPASNGAGGVVVPTDTHCPPSHPIKGNRESMIYHLPGGGFYQQTRPEYCFATSADAEAAGFRPSQR
ncbi:MAG: hypothetical protein AB7P40_28670 [Chloroflexota bacterium]